MPCVAADPLHKYRNRRRGPTARRVTVSLIAYAVTPGFQTWSPGYFRDGFLYYQLTLASRPPNDTRSLSKSNQAPSGVFSSALGAANAGRRVSPGLVTCTTPRLPPDAVASCTMSQAFVLVAQSISISGRRVPCRARWRTPLRAVRGKLLLILAPCFHA